MTLTAYLITLRGRIREALVPELQELRDRLAREKELNDQLCVHADDALNKAYDDGRRYADEYWQRRVEPMREEARYYKESYFKLLEMAANLKAMQPGGPVFLAAPASAVDAAMNKERGDGN